MPHYLSDDELKRTSPAEIGSFRSPVPTQIVSNGEYNPLPQTDQQAKVEALIKEMADVQARRHGIDRRRFLQSSAGMATAFLAMNKVFGPVFDVSEAEAHDMEMSEYRAKQLAAQARSYGATVYEIYSPNATWTKVKATAQGANILIYLGHGNGYPSPYGSFQRYTKDGLGLNATSGNGNSNVKYWGEYYIDRDIQMAPNAVVILARLCYASGNSEWGSANPTKSTAIKRVDNYGAGFLRAGAKAVFAEGITDVRYIIKNLYTSNRTMREIFFASPSRTMSYRFHFTSSRTSWAVASMDPYKPSRYYRSVIGKLSVTAADWRAS